MFSRKRIYILIVITLLVKSGLAQTTYITDSSYFEKISDFYFLKKNIHGQYEYPDTSVINFQYSLPFYFNGQTGTAQPDYLFQQQDDEIGSRIMQLNFPDILKKENIPLYRTKGFYSKLEGIAGSKDEQHFRALFISPVKQNHQINFYFRRSTNIGFYLNQKASVTNLLADYHWFGNGRISMNAHLLLNYIKHQENGGIIKDSLSYNDLFLDKTLIPVALSDAKKNIRNHEFEYRVNYLLRNDSVLPQALSLSLSANQLIYQYQDNQPLSGYYSFVFLDTLKTNDSLHSLKIDMPLSYSLRWKRTYTQLDYDYQWNKIHLFSDSVFNNHILKNKSESNFNMFGKIKTKLGNTFEYVFYGTQKDNYLINFFIQSEYKKMSLKITADILRQSPTFQQNYWYSNHFIWKNQLKDILTQKFSITLKYLSDIQLSYQMFFIENYVYYINGYPQSYNNKLNIQQLHLYINKVFFKHIGINAHYYYQWKNSNVVALPEHFLHSNLYYQGKWFKKNLLVNAGVQLVTTFNYFDTYQYTPALGIYSVGLNNIQAGQYPQVGIYFSGRIKPVNFFIRMDNILSGIYSRPYYFVPHYMMPDRSLRMGISWMFFD